MSNPGSARPAPLRLWVSPKVLPTATTANGNDIRASGGWPFLISFRDARCCNCCQPKESCRRPRGHQATSHTKRPPLWGRAGTPHTPCSVIRGGSDYRLSVRRCCLPGNVPGVYGSAVRLGSRAPDARHDMRAEICWWPGSLMTTMPPGVRANKTMCITANIKHSCYVLRAPRWTSWFDLPVGFSC